jgi:hypothetical protein
VTQAVITSARVRVTVTARIAVSSVPASVLLHTRLLAKPGLLQNSVSLAIGKLKRKAMARNRSSTEVAPPEAGVNVLLVELGYGVS